MDKYGEQFHYKNWHVTKHAMSRYRFRCGHLPLRDILDGAKLSPEFNAVGRYYKYENILLVVAEYGPKKEVITMHPCDDGRPNIDNVGYLVKNKGKR